MSERARTSAQPPLNWPTSCLLRCRPYSEAEHLQAELAKQNIHLHILNKVKLGDDISDIVFGTMAACMGFIVFGTKDYGEKTGNPAASDKELSFWQNYMMKKGKVLIPLRMIPWEEDFDHIAAKVVFNTNSLTLTWIKGEPLPRTLVTDILKAMISSGVALKGSRNDRRRAKRLRSLKDLMSEESPAHSAAQGAGALQQVQLHLAQPTCLPSPP